MSTTDPIAALRAVDDALASGRASAADSVERELQELALALEAESPAPDPEFERRLDALVADRFGRRKRRPALAGFRRPRLALAGVAASALVVVAVAGALSGLFGGHDQVITSAFPAQRRPQAPVPLSDLSRKTSPSAATIAPQRRVERSSELTLAAPDDRLDRVGGQILQVVDRHRGYVLSSSLSSGQGSSHSGSFELRVPSSQLQSTIADLSRLAEVRSRTDSGHDVTGTFASVSDRLTADLVERRGLLRQLSHATTTHDADRLRSRLDRLSIDIQQLRGQLSSLKRRTDYTRVSVFLVAKSRRGATGPLGGVDRALRGSLHSLVAATAILLRVAAAVLPFALLGALAWAVAGGVKRRRREAVLS